VKSLRLEDDAGAAGEPSQARLWWPVWGALSLAAALRVRQIFALPYDVDEPDRLHEAFALAQGGKPFIDFMDFRPLLPQWLLSQVVEVVGVAPLWVYRLVSTAVGLLALWVWTRALSRFVRRDVAVRAAFLSAIPVATTYGCATIRPEPWVVLFASLGVIVAAPPTPPASPRLPAMLLRSAGAGALFLLALFAKVTVLPFVGVAALACVVLAARALAAHGAARLRRVTALLAVALAAGFAVATLVAVNIVYSDLSKHGPLTIFRLWINLMGTDANRFQPVDTTVVPSLAVDAWLYVAALAATAWAVWSGAQAGRRAVLIPVASGVVACMGYAAVLVLKRSVHMQDLMPVAFAATVPVAWAWARVADAQSARTLDSAAARRQWRIAGFAVVGGLIVAHFVGFAAYAGRRGEAIQPNPWVPWGAYRLCAADRADPSDRVRARAFLDCLGGRFVDGAPLERLTRPQQDAAERFFREVTALVPMGTTGSLALRRSFSGARLNVFSRTPTQLQNSHSPYPTYPTAYDAVNGTNGSPKIPGAVLTSILVRPNLFLAREGGVNGALYELLAVSEPPIVVALDQRVLEIYRAVPGLVDHLDQHYRVVFDLPSNGFYAIHRVVPEAALDRLLRSPTRVAAADRALWAFWDAVDAGQPFDIEALLAAARAALALDVNHPEALRIRGLVAWSRGWPAVAVGDLVASARASGGRDLDVVLDAAEALRFYRSVEAGVAMRAAALGDYRVAAYAPGPGLFSRANLQGPRRWERLNGLGAATCNREGCTLPGYALPIEKRLRGDYRFE
jgi:hypothetical protein